MNSCGPGKSPGEDIKASSMLPSPPIWPQTPWSWSPSDPPDLAGHLIFALHNHVSYMNGVSLLKWSSSPKVEKLSWSGIAALLRRAQHLHSLSSLLTMNYTTDAISNNTDKNLIENPLHSSNSETRPQLFSFVLMLVFRVTALFQSLRKEHQATPDTGKRTLETPVCDLQSKHDFFPLFFFLPFKRWRKSGEGS